MESIIVIGGGLAGSEAAWQIAEQGIEVTLYEMRPTVTTGAHATGLLAELICSNSMGSILVDRASGLLKEELRRLGSLLVRCAEETMVPAGGALAVDRKAFSQRVTEKICNHSRITLVRKEIRGIPPGLVVVASGPLTSPALSESIRQFTGEEHMFFYDALAPIITLESVNMGVAYRASRYQVDTEREGDYINCPLTRDEYLNFVKVLTSAERVRLHDFEIDIAGGVKAGAHHYFEGCLPVEVLAARSPAALAFGPMRPVGLFNPHTRQRPFAVVQLRQDNLLGNLFNLVGFQTNLTFLEQKRVFQLIPGLEKAEFVRFGQMHRNTFIASPTQLLPTLQHKKRKMLLFAGQITGVEGYMGNIATGLLAGMNAVRVCRQLSPLELPETTMLGALCRYITRASLADFQPMKANYGLLPRPDCLIMSRRERAQWYSNRALKELDRYLCEIRN